jgi:hypothetical protein
MTKTKNILLLTAVFVVFTFAFSGITYADENNSTRILYAGQTINVGTVTISNDTTHLYVTYETTGNWTILETHLGVANYSNSLPINNGGNIVPGQCEYKNDSIPAGTSTYEYVIPLETYLPAENNTLYIVAHAVVSDGNSEEGAWANGTKINENSWATYFTYITSKTDDENDVDEEDPEDLNISINKTAEFNDVNNDGAQQGENITYYFVVENTGNVNLTNVNVTDIMFTPSEIEAPNGFTGILLPGENVTYTINYTLTLTDIEAGWVNNTATTTGISPMGTIVTNTDSVDFELPVEENGSTTEEEDPEDLNISINKTAEFNDENNDGAQQGENITYYFVVENTGNVNLTNVNVTDTMFTPSEIKAPKGFTGTLLPGENVTYSINYTLTQIDIEAGWVNNTAITAGISPMGTIVTNTDSVDFEIPVEEDTGTETTQEKDEDSSKSGGFGGSSGSASYSKEVTATEDDKNRFFSASDIPEKNETVMSIPDSIPELIQQEPVTSEHTVLRSILWYIIWLLLSAICVMSGYGLTQP